MQVQLNGWQAQPKELILGVKGNYGVDTLTINWSPEWEELEKIVVFDAGNENGAVQVALLEGHDVQIPQQVLQKSWHLPHCDLRHSRGQSPLFGSSAGDGFGSSVGTRGRRNAD